MIAPPNAQVYYDSKVFWTSTWTDVCEIWKQLFDDLKPLQIKSLINVGIGTADECVLWNRLFRDILGTTEFLNIDFDSKHVDRARASSDVLLNNAQLCDVRQIDKIITKKYDAVFWSHGPEHIKREEWQATFEALAKVAGKAIICQCPWGSGYDNDPEHLSKSIKQHEWLTYNFTVRTGGVKNTAVALILGSKIL